MVSRIAVLLMLFVACGCSGPASEPPKKLTPLEQMRAKMLSELDNSIAGVKEEFALAAAEHERWELRAKVRGEDVGEYIRQRWAEGDAYRKERLAKLEAERDKILATAKAESAK